ncbi:MAG: hypothetical protein FWE98_02595 [Oscillospiraceae bacterium]|nr:hypothetical protein [Oscillospiraceae bacterium]
MPPKKNPLPKVGAIATGAGIIMTGPATAAMPPAKADSSYIQQEASRDVVAELQAQLLAKTKKTKEYEVTRAVAVTTATTLRRYNSDAPVTLSALRKAAERDAVEAAELMAEWDAAIYEAERVALDPDATYDAVVKANDAIIEAAFKNGVVLPHITPPPISKYKYTTTEPPMITDDIESTEQTISWNELLDIAASISTILGVGVLELMKRLKTKSERKGVPCNQRQKIQIILGQPSWTTDMLASRLAEPRDLAEAKLMTYGYSRKKRTQFWEETEITEAYRRELKPLLQG